MIVKYEIHERVPNNAPIGYKNKDVGYATSKAIITEYIDTKNDIVKY